jgi:two-component system response regulator
LTPEDTIHRKILLVEDNPDDVELMIQALKKNNIMNELIITRDGEEALKYIFCKGPYSGRDPLDLPSVVLLDLNLPKMGGLDVLKRVRENEDTEMLPVVILTSSKDEEDLMTGYRLGANSYIRKPVDFKEFVKVIGDLGLYWLLHNEPPPKSK